MKISKERTDVVEVQACSGIISVRKCYKTN